MMVAPNVMSGNPNLIIVAMVTMLAHDDIYVRNGREWEEDFHVSHGGH